MLEADSVASTELFVLSWVPSSLSGWTEGEAGAVELASPLLSPFAFVLPDASALPDGDPLSSCEDYALPPGHA